jgi:hypothetical protein
LKNVHNETLQISIAVAAYLIGTFAYPLLHYFQSLCLKWGLPMHQLI